MNACTVNVHIKENPERKSEIIFCRNKFKLKKEKFKIEHEKNLLQIQINQQTEKMEHLNQEHNNMSIELEQVSRQVTGDKQKDSGYIGQLQKMNELQAKENIVLMENQKKNEIKYRREVEKTKKEYKDKNQKSTKDNEKMISQLL